jgi:hypothetical protein
MKSVHTGGNNDDSNGNPNLLFRRDDASVEYTNVAFLNDEVVVAADKYGEVDVVRLPRFNQQPDDTDCDAKRDNLNAPDKGINMGKLVGNRLGWRTMCSPTYVKFKSLQNGAAFVTGMPSGEFRVFATEHASTWQNHARESDSNFVSITTQSSFLKKAFRIGGPRRRYLRNTCASIQQIIQRSGMIPESDCFSQEEILDWDLFASERAYHAPRNNGPTYQKMTQKRMEEHRWDFRECSAGSLLAAHVDSDRDCFSIHIADNRTDCKKNEHSFNTRSCTKPTICIDMESKDNGNMYQEDINAICFVTDHSIATAHTIWKNPTGMEADCTNLIKLWDIRKLDEQAVTESLMSSFPLDKVHPLRPIKTKQILRNECTPGNMDASGSNIIRSDAKPSFISRLSSSCNNTGTLLVSRQMLDKHYQGRWSSEESMVDLTSDSSTNITHISSIAELCNERNFMAITPEHDFMVTCGKNVEDNTVGPDSMFFYDLSKVSNSSSVREYENTSLPFKRKRREAQPNNDRSALSTKGSGCCIGAVPICLMDRDCLPSIPSCIGLNGSGTALVCGSEDGDLFLWRGG